MSVVYILGLEDDCWYVGQTDDFNRRLSEHLEGRGAAWTSLHRPLVWQFYENQQSEEWMVIELMATYGVDQVRGGSFSSIELSDADRVTITKMIDTRRNRCFTCHQTGHFTKRCPTNPRVADQPETAIDPGLLLLSEDSPDDSEELSDDIYDPQWKCPTCSTSFDSARNLWLHHKNSCSVQRATRPMTSAIEAVETEHECAHCGKTFETEKGMLYHQKKYCPEIHGMKWECGDCRKRFTSQAGLKLHLKLHCKGPTKKR